MKCPNCGISVPDLPEDASYDEGLCNQCYEEWEKKQEGVTHEKES